MLSKEVKKSIQSLKKKKSAISSWILVKVNIGKAEPFYKINYRLTRLLPPVSKFYENYFQ